MRHNYPVSRFRSLLAMCAALLCSVADAATFGLSPMRVDLSGSAPTAVLTVTNGGAEPLTVQLQARAWRQVDGQDEQAPTGDFILNPGQVTIAPNSEQIVRIALRSGPDRTQERAYRLVVRELPVAADTDQPGLRMALAMDIPVFIAPVAADAVARPGFSIEMQAGGGQRLRIANEGGLHLRLTGLVVSQGGRTLAEQGVFVVLPGAVRYISLPAASAAAGPLRLKAQSNAGPFDLTLGNTSGR